MRYQFEAETSSGLPLDLIPAHEAGPGHGARPHATGGASRFWLSQFNLSRSFDRCCLLFVIVSALDAFMTWTLLTRHAGEIVESNPLALFFLNQWGFPGMLAFKALLVSVVLFNYAIIVCYKEPVARRVVDFGTVVVNTVVLYSVFLLVSHEEIENLVVDGSAYGEVSDETLLATSRR
jgi:hypothetical protein